MRQKGVIVQIKKGAKKVATVVLVGLMYDDFSEGGFRIIGVGSNMEEAKKIADRYRKEFVELRDKYPGIFRNGIKTQPQQVEFKTKEVNDYYSPF